MIGLGTDKRTFTMAGMTILFLFSASQYGLI